MFLHKISTQVVCVHGKHPYDILESMLGNLSLFSAVKLLGETMVQTDATFIWPTILNIVGCYTLCVVAQSLKPLKLLAQCKRTQYCCVRLQVDLKSTP